MKKINFIKLILKLECFFEKTHHIVIEYETNFHREA
jgi:hypothetical protein